MTTVTTQQVCKYYSQGTCKYGNACKFKHITTAINYNLFKHQPICKYYTQGTCTKGNSCAYKHINLANATPTTYLLSKQTKIQNKSTIQAALIVALVSFITDVILIPIVAFFLCITIWNAYDQPPCTYPTDYGTQVCYCPHWTESVDDYDSNSCNPWTGLFDGQFFPTSNFCYLVYWPLAILPNFARGAFVLLFLVIMFIASICLFLWFLFTVCFCFVVAILYELLWLFAKILLIKVKDPQLVIIKLFNDMRIWAVELYWKIFYFFFGYSMEFIIAIFAKKWGYIFLQLTNLCGAIVMIVFPIYSPIIHVKCYDIYNPANTTTLPWNTSWYCGFHHSGVFILICIYLVLILFCVLSRRIFFGILFKIKAQVQSKYQLLIFKYFRIIKV